MTEKLLENLKELRNIRPDAGYSRHSRALILLSQKEKKENWITEAANVFYGAKFKMVTALAMIIVVTLLGGVYYVTRINQNDLVVKASEINSSIQVNLYGIKYLLENQPAINPLIVPNVQKLLEEANNDLKEAAEMSKDPNKLKEALEKIKTAQELFQQINSFFK